MCTRSDRRKYCRIVDRLQSPGMVFSYMGREGIWVMERRSENMSNLKTDSPTLFAPM